MIRLAIASDVRFIAEALEIHLGRDARIEVVSSALDRGSQRGFARDTDADVVLLDATLSDGFDRLDELHRRRHAPKVVVLGLPEDPEVILPWAERGISGYVHPDCSLEQLVRIVAQVARGEFECPPRVAAHLLERVGTLWGTLRQRSAPPPRVHLTPRETEIMELVDRGLSNKKIARTLGITISTTKNHVHNILKKLNASRRSEAAAIVRRWRSVKAPRGRRGRPRTPSGRTVRADTSEVDRPE